ncbi:MAG: DNRLRE domain-containing protein [Acidobacteriota bacterium]
MRRTLQGVALVLGLMMTTSPGSAETVRLLPDRDTTLFEDNRQSEPALGELSSGAGQWLFTGLGPKNRRALLRFDLGALPASAEIVSAKLEMTVDRTRCGPSPVRLHRLLADWGEAGSSTDHLGGGGGGAQARPDDATWLHRFYDQQLWQEAGGDYVAEASAEIAVDQEGTYEWMGLAPDVQRWLAEPATNFGWIAIGEETEAPTTKRYFSREGTTGPQLEITFRLP